MLPQHRRPWSLTARWVFPVESPPLENGVVTIVDQRIVAVEPGAGRPADHDFGTAAILPGLVNAHTHLDLEPLADVPRPPVRFTAWLKAVVTQRRSRSPEQVQRTIRAGLRQALRYGTTLLGDIASQGVSWDVFTTRPRCRAVVFYELLGLLHPRAHQAWAAACQWLHNHPAQETCRPGLSPHAPYSVRAALFRAAARLAQRHGLPLAIHLAESREELELLEHQRGPFVAFLQELGAWDAQGLIPSVAELLEMQKQVNSFLCVHGNYVGRDVPLPAEASLVYCPRTHAAFGHAPHPFRQHLAAGGRVALGTDSLASNPDLNVLAEARFLHEQDPTLPGAALLRMATLSGAEALGWQQETGSLRAGKSADLVVQPLASAAHSDPYEALWSTDEPVQAVLFRGRWVYRRA